LRISFHHDPGHDDASLELALARASAAPHMDLIGGAEGLALDLAR